MKIKDDLKAKKSQMISGYGEIVIEVLEKLNEAKKYNKEYYKDQLLILILDNLELSEKFINSSDTLEHKEIMKIRVQHTLESYLDIIFCQHYRLLPLDIILSAVRGIGF